ncbi:hypothetical protein E2C01_037395 [Portunus trituberculatus]|uniref:Uncharacterized protein n=1 Tax=Portunus trituberculatus TaxID=210409 RepID=A0A5B7FF74_PORTR|nr:hypothetical protein [Portunus trituberculatus]
MPYYRTIGERGRENYPLIVQVSTRQRSEVS